ncbi:EAL domain-containing protein [Oceanospirillum sediminis]|uniref:EAL domain-containing protein n=1 Tax=Oceanospirillum sediminis TaxID=2760088 RepID=A0A839IXB2_9GAMM|nr:EAL domain-containing protein [Oceanospirillum sediminis]MBB1489254.1 EAL domain-containing protein [Oceanospirillum sediminis]
MKLQHKLYAGLSAILLILLTISGLILSQEHQKRVYSRQLMELYRPAELAMEGLNSSAARLSADVILSLSPAMRRQVEPLQPAIEQFNRHLDTLSVLITGTSLSGLPLHRLRDDADRQAEYAVALVSQYQSLRRDRMRLEDNVHLLMDRLRDSDASETLAVQAFENSLAQLTLFVSTSFYNRTDPDRSQLEQAEQQLADRMDQLRSRWPLLAEQPEVRHLTGEIRYLYRRITEHADFFYLKRSQYHLAFQDVQQQLGQIQSDISKTSQQAIQQLEAMSRNSRMIEYVLVPLAILITALLGWQTAWRIRAPLAELLKGIQCARTGDFSFRLETDSRDEVALLSHHFNEMLDDLDQATVSHSYLQQILDALQHAVIVTDDDFNIRFFNATAFSYFQTRAGVGKPIAGFRTSEGAMLLSEAERVLLCQQSVLSGLEKKICLPDGEKVVVALAAAELKVNQERHWVISLHDITLMKEAEKSLQLYARLFETSNDAIVISDKQNVIEQVNPAFSRITGYEEHEAIGKNPGMLSSGRQDKAFYRVMWAELMTKGRWQGEIWNRKKSGEAYAEWLSIVAIYDQSGLIERFIGVFSDITQRKEAEQLIYHQANYDALTELPNRRLFWDRLEHALTQARASSGKVALMYLDLDGFKPVNDTFGHEAGDLLLQHVSEKLRALVQPSDTVARLGGDEFALILPAYSIRKLEQLADKLIDAVSSPVSLLDKQIRIGVSVGISCYPDIATDREQLVQQADVAMYYVKGKNKNSYIFYNQQMKQDTWEKIRLEQELREAIDRGQLEVIFQPLYDASTEVIVSAEALLRWRHPVKGVLMPDMFIPLAEENGMIHDLGEWVLREVCTLARTYLEDKGYVRVAVNISAQQLTQPDFVSRLESILHETGFPACHLELEIKEKLIVNDLTGTAKILQQLSRSGISIAIDDFGLSYTSLNSLSHYSVKELKLDRRFIKAVAAESEDSHMVKAMADMAHQMGMKVVAEGVEDDKSLQLLKQLGCDLIQGFVYQDAVSIHELSRLLQVQARNTQPATNPDME